MWNMTTRKDNDTTYVVVTKDGIEVDAWKVFEDDTVEEVWSIMNTLYFGNEY